mgnify:CR=1 FL=1
MAIKSEKLTPFGGILSIMEKFGSVNRAVIQREFDLSSALLLKQRLLQEGKSDLLFSRLSVKETAYRLHFFEPNHLMRFFKQMTRQAISKFIKSIK